MKNGQWKYCAEYGQKSVLTVRVCSTIHELCKTVSTNERNRKHRKRNKQYEENELCGRIIYGHLLKY